MPQAKKITLGTQEFEPESITRENVVFQDLAKPLGARDLLFFNRNADENSQRSKPIVRVVTIRLFEEVTGQDGSTSFLPCTATLRLTMDRGTTSAHRGKLLTQMAAACADADVEAIVKDPSWMF